MRRWVEAATPDTKVVAVEVMRGEAWERLQMVDAEAVDEHTGELLSGALQDEADARGRGQRVIARAAAYGEQMGEPLATISLRASASEDAEPLDSTEHDTSEVGRVQQQMEHTQALMKLSLDERMMTSKQVRQVMEMQGQVIHWLIERDRAQVAQVDALRATIAKAAPEWLEAAKVVVPALAPVLGRLAGAVAKKGSAPAKTGPGTSPGASSGDPSPPNVPNGAASD